MGKSGSRSNLENPSFSGMNGHAAENASRQYSTPRNLELILNPLLRVPEYEFRTGTKLRQQSPLDKTPDEDWGPSSPNTQTDESMQGPFSGQEDQVVLQNSQTSGALLPKHARIPER